MPVFFEEPNIPVFSDMWKGTVLRALWHILLQKTAEDLELFGDNKMSSPVVADMLLCHVGTKGCH